MSVCVPGTSCVTVIPWSLIESVAMARAWVLLLALLAMVSAVSAPHDADSCCTHCQS